MIDMLSYLVVRNVQAVRGEGLGIGGHISLETNANGFVRPLHYRRHRFNL